MSQKSRTEQSDGFDPARCARLDPGGFAQEKPIEKEHNDRTGRDGQRAAAGAGIAAITGGDIATYALAGAAAGGLAGYFVDKDGDCDGYNNNRYLDDDCFGTAGYPADPRY